MSVHPQTGRIPIDDYDSDDDDRWRPPKMLVVGPAGRLYCIFPLLPAALSHRS